MAPETQKETPKSMPTLREKMANALDRHPVFEEVSTDSETYTRLSTGLKALLLHSLRAADAIEKNLMEDEKLLKEDPKKLPAEQIEKREAFLTEVASWTVTIPHLLRVTRGIQFQPAVQERMDSLATLIHDQLKVTESVEKNRAAIVANSEFSEETLARLTIWELSYIATYEWLKVNPPKPKEKVMRDPEMLKQYLEYVGNLQEQEKEEKKSVKETQKGTEEMREEADFARALEGAERVSQGYPGAEYVLDIPAASLKTWKLLLIDGGPREKKRASKQLGEGVGKFQDDFLERKAFENYRSLVESVVSKAKLDNDLARRASMLDKILPIIGDSVEKRLTTDPEAFDAWFEKNMEEASAAFSEIGSEENKNVCTQLRQLLSQMETGMTVDLKELSRLLDAYTEIQEKNRTLMSKLRNSQLVEQAFLSGGRGKQSRAEQMIDQGTRVNGKSGIEWMRRLAPYGSFQTRGFWETQDRFVLLPPAGGVFHGRSALGSAAELGKLGIESVGVTVALHQFIKAVGFLTFKPIAGPAARIATPILMAEGQMAVAKGAAHQEIIAQHVKSINTLLKDLESLQRGEDLDGKKLAPELTKQMATQAAVRLQASMRVILQVSQASVNPLAAEYNQAKPDPFYDLEAHVYANQVMNAFGFPGYHRLTPSFKVPEDLSKASPEVRQYVDIKQSEAKKATHAQLDAFRLYVERARQKPEKAAVQPKTRIQRILDEGYLPMGGYADNVEALVKATLAPELKPFLDNYEATVKREEALDLAGKVFRLQSELAVARRDIVAPTLHQMSRAASGKTTKFEDLVSKPEMKRLSSAARELADIPMREVLSLSIYLDKNPPTNDEFKEVYKGIKLAKVHFEKYFGPQGKRYGVKKQFLEEWVMIRRFADQFAPKELK